MRCQQNTHVLDLCHLTDGITDALFGDHIQADGRLIEEKQLGAVKERGGNFATHSLSQRKFADGSLQQLTDLKRLREKADAFLRFNVIHLKDLAKETEGVYGWQVIPQLRALTEDRADMISELLPLLPRDVTEHFCISA